MVTLTLLQVAAEDLIPRIKASTAYLTNQDLGSTGTAFCISRQGHFMTCAHVLGGLRPGKEVTLTIYPGLPESKDTKATILRVDNSMDLALLKVGPEFAKPLPLGDAGKLKETDVVTVAGFPFGRLLALEERPAISIGTGKITALRRDSGLLSQLQFDADIQSGNSGGPVLNSKGEVVGVTASRVPGSRLSFAIASDLVSALITVPSARIENLKDIPFSARHQPYSFDLKLDFVNPPTSPPKIAAHFKGNQSSSRPVGIEKISGEHYRITGIPHPKEKSNLERGLRTELIRISGNFTHSETLSHEDLEFTIGGKKYALSQMKVIKPLEEKAWTNGGELLSGPIAGLDEVMVPNPGYRPRRYNFMNWPMVAVRPDGFKAETIRLEVKITTGRFVNTLAGTLPLERIDDFNSPAFQPEEKRSKILDVAAPLLEKPVEIKFDREITDLDYGMNGRFVAVLVAGEETCHVIDCLSGETIHKIPATADSIVAAGYSTLFLANSSGVHKWDLKSGKNIAKDLPWFDGQVLDLAVGAGSDRHLGVSYRRVHGKKTVSIELRSQNDGEILAIEPIGMKASSNSLISISERGCSLGISIARPGASLGLLQLEGSRYQYIPLGSGGWVIPGPADDMLVSGSGRIGIGTYGFGGKRNRGPKFGLIPTSNRFLALMVPLPVKESSVGKDSKPNLNGRFGFLDTASGRPLAENVLSLDRFAVDPAASAGGTSGAPGPKLPWSERFYYSIEHGHLIAVPGDNRRLLIHPIDLKKTLDQEETPYLIIDSNAPHLLKGDSFEAKLSVLSSDDMSSFEIISAPSGFKVDDQGVVSGKIDPTERGNYHRLVVLVKTKECERFWKHRFYSK